MLSIDYYFCTCLEKKKLILNYFAHSFDMILLVDIRVQRLLYMPSSLSFDMSDMLFNNGLQYNGMSSSSLQWSSGLDMKPMVCITSAQGGGEYGVKIKHPVKDGRIIQ